MFSMAIPGEAFRKLEHFFVLMLENRSFDHMLGVVPSLQSNPLTGSETCPLDPDKPTANLVSITHDAGDVTQPDPPHEFRDVCYQLTGRTDGDYRVANALSMKGFAASARAGLLQGESTSAKNRLVGVRARGEYALRCQGIDAIPVLRRLASEFVVFDRWYSSMPGPTWPNRFFVHAGSSGGLDNSPSSARAGAAVVIDELGFNFEHGTIYDRLGTGNWRIYHDDTFPQVLAIKGIVKQRFGPLANHFRKLRHLADDLKSGEPVPKYIFIEPNHAIASNSRNGNSQHPEGRVAAGEQLIKSVYEAIRGSSVWEKSALVITYDEHGGFYDREVPPPAIPPGDKSLNHRKGKFPANFKFDLLGVRVPTVVVSPWVERNIVDHELYDHTSILRTLEERFGIAPLTARDAAANDFAHLFTRETLRSDAPEFLETAGESQETAESDDLEPLDDYDLSIGNTAGFLRIAMSVEYLIKEQEATIIQRGGHLFEAQLRPLLAQVAPSLARMLPSLAITRTPVIESHTQARNYISRVAAQLEELAEEMQTR